MISKINFKFSEEKIRRRSLRFEENKRKKKVLEI